MQRGVGACDCVGPDTKEHEDSDLQVLKCRVKLICNKGSKQPLHTAYSDTIPFTTASLKCFHAGC